MLDQTLTRRVGSSMLDRQSDVNVVSSSGTAESSSQQVHTALDNAFSTRTSSAPGAKPHVGGGAYVFESQRAQGLAERMLNVSAAPASSFRGKYEPDSSVPSDTVQSSSQQFNTRPAFDTTILQGASNQSYTLPSTNTTGPYAGFQSHHSMQTPPLAMHPHMHYRAADLQDQLSELVDAEGVAHPGWKSMGLGGWREYTKGADTRFREPYKPGDPLVLPPLPKQ
ncbi:hypothetical protein EJ03DRAFT_8589 [Teratosphaeria nubilosa]|uniref:Uncharacterized protein n=1 Tax=Teratosphaeria nubilosa TaxID=161662 RepID=A0A6G1LNQ5_9PEZI|nr:hypothetical protein EJ03DRAFT_8589 [Teratosphaeria nubilosa]